MRSLSRSCAFDHARRDEGDAVFLASEAGTGKSALIHAAARADGADRYNGAAPSSYA